MPQAAGWSGARIVAMSWRIVPIAEEHIEGFGQAIDSVARERRYLALLEMKMAMAMLFNVSAEPFSTSIGTTRACAPIFC